MKASLFLVLIAATAALAKNYYAETPLQASSRRRVRIVGGEEAVPHSIPFQVGLIILDAFCAGSLITKRFVLTAAHCGVLTKTPIVILGAHKINEEEPEQITVTAKDFTVHEKFNKSTIENDIALIELPQEITFTQSIQPAKLAPSNAGLFVGATAKVSGWGVIRDDPESHSPVLRVVESTILSNDDCQDQFGKNIKIFPSMMCLDGSKLKGPCYGDNGGPLFIKNENETIQIGIVSFGSDNGCESGFPTVFTRLTFYPDWIQKNSDYKYEINYF